MANDKSSKKIKYKDQVKQRNMEYIYEAMQDLPSWYEYYFNELITYYVSNTVKSYTYDIREYFRYLSEKNPHFKNIDPRDFTIEQLRVITLPDAKAYLAYLISNGISPTTCRAYFSALRSLWRFFTETYQFDNNPFAAVRMPKKEKFKSAYLHKEESESFYDAALTGQGVPERIEKYREKHNTSFRDYLICRIMGITGIRVSELVGLDLEDIDLKHNVFKVIIKGNTNKSTDYYFNQELADEISYYISEERPQFEPQKDEHALFLVSQGPYKGTRLSVRSVQSLVKKYAKSAGVLNANIFSPHSLRHSFASDTLRESNGNLVLVQRLMNHSNIETTAGYIEMETDELKDFMQTKDKN